jgi:ketosteroid isomerase-like protein
VSVPDACRTGHYVLISREEAISNSFASLGLMVAQVQSQIAGVRCRRHHGDPQSRWMYGDRFRSRAHQLTPRLLQVARYINDNREAVMEQTAMEIATLETSDATVVRAIQALGFAGLRDLKQTLEQWFGPVVTSSEKMSTTVNTLTSDVNASIDFVLEGHQHTCEVLSNPTTATRWRRRSHCWRRRGRSPFLALAPPAFWPSTPPGCSAVWGYLPRRSTAPG